MRKIYFVVGSVLVVCGVFQLSTANYQDFCETLLSAYQKTDKLAVFQQKYLSATRFFYLKLVSIATSLAAWLVFFFHWNSIKKGYCQIKIFLKTFFIIHFHKIRFIYRSLNITEKLALLFPLLTYIVFWWIYGWHIDEIFSYTFFVDKGVLVCASYYPAPNNHVAYLLIAAVLDKFVTDFVAMKLPATLFAWLSLVSLWVFFAHYHSKTLAWIVFFLVALLWDFFFYAAHGRGYSLLVLCIVWQTIAVFKLETSSNSVKQTYFWWLIWVVSTIVGCYSVPIFVYAWFGSLLGIGLLSSSTMRWQSITASSCVTLGLLMLYAPILVFNGLDALTANDWVKPIPFDEWLHTFPSYFFSMHTPIGFCALVVSGFLFVTTPKYRRIISYAWILILSPYIVLAFQRVFPFERTWIAQKVAALILLLWSVYELLHPNIRRGDVIIYLKKLFCLFLFIYILFRMSYEYWHWKIRVNEYHFAPQLAKRIKAMQPNAILVLEDTYNVFLRYEFKHTNTPIDVKPETRTYEVILIPKATPLHAIITNDSIYQLIYEDKFIRTFHRIPE